MPQNPSDFVTISSVTESKRKQMLQSIPFDRESLTTVNNFRSVTK